jgi:hypothetical protein
MYEKKLDTKSLLPKARRIQEGEPVYFSVDTLEQNKVATVGSLYLGEASNSYDRQELEEDNLRFDIIDLRSAPIEGGAKTYADQSFDPSVRYLVVQGSPDWQSGKGFKGLRSGEVLTIGRNDPISARRFNLNDSHISRTHATISETENGLVIEDNDSANGTSYVKYDTADEVTLPQVEQRTDNAPLAPHEISTRTESNLARVIESSEVQNWRLYMNETKGSQCDTVKDLVENSRVAPVAGIEIDNTSFLFSEIMQTEHRKFAIGYVSNADNPGSIMPRLFYQSVSDGGWRSAPYINRSGMISKGTDTRNEEDEYGHYVQMTKPNEDIIAVLERQDRLQADRQERGEAVGYKSIAYKELKQLYERERIENEVQPIFSDEVSVTEVRGANMDAYISGVGSPDTSLSREKLHGMELPEGFEPDFSGEPSKAYRTKHSLAGEAEVEVFPATLNGRAINWHVAHDREHNRVWVDRIVYQDGGVTSYGTQKEVIIAGALSAKPFDYIEQLGGMAEGRDWSRHSELYGDVSATLDEIPAIKHYRLSRAIYRK